MTDEKILIEKVEASIVTVQDQIDFWVVFPTLVPKIPELRKAINILRKELTKRQ